MSIFTDTYIYFASSKVQNYRNEVWAYHITEVVHIRNKLYVA